MAKRALTLFGLLAPVTIAAACTTFGAATDDVPAVDAAPVEGSPGDVATVPADASQVDVVIERRCSNDSMCDSRKCVAALCEPLVFVSSTVLPGGFGGLAKADQTCTNAARSAGLTGTYRAFVGLESKSPIDDEAFVKSMRPYWRTDAKKIADSFEALKTINLQNAIACDEKGNCPTGVYAWSATSRNGVNHAADCMQWTNSTSGFGGIGQTDVTNESWAAGMQDSCSAMHPLYCFEQLE